MDLPSPRGALSERLFAAMTGAADVPAVDQASGEDDRQIALWVLYEQHYRGFDDVDPRLEWDPALLALRADLEARFEAEIRELTKPCLVDALGNPRGVVAQLEQIVASDDGPSLANYLQRHATHEQYREFLVQRSIYHLKESDPHAWAVPRLSGTAKVALAELQYDEFGSGVAENLHQQLFADALEGAGLDPTYGAYVDRASGSTLAVNNAMSLFGLHRRLRGACMGHLAAFEMTSSLPCRRYGQGAGRLGMHPSVLRYFDEHVEADAVHEQLAARDICQRLVESEPALLEDVLLGAATCVQLDALAGRELIEGWRGGHSSLVPVPREDVA